MLCMRCVAYSAPRPRSTTYWLAKITSIMCRINSSALIWKPWTHIKYICSIFQSLKYITHARVGVTRRVCYELRHVQKASSSLGSIKTKLKKKKKDNIYEKIIYTIYRWTMNMHASRVAAARGSTNRNVVLSCICGIMWIGRRVQIRWLHRRPYNFAHPEDIVLIVSVGDF